MRNSPQRSRWSTLLLWLTGMLPFGLLIVVVPSAGGDTPPESVPKSDSQSECTATIGDETARRIQARYETIRDLRGLFVQTSESATFGSEPLMAPEPRTGRVEFAKPGKMRWSYEEPERSVVVSNGQQLWIYDVDAKSATLLEVTEGFLSGAALQFLLGDGQILESFRVEARSCQPDQIVIDLIPKADSTYERLGLFVEPESAEIRGTSVIDLFGNRTRIEFSDVEYNRSPGAEVFEFEVPEGVELIELEGMPTR